MKYSVAMKICVCQIQNTLISFWFFEAPLGYKNYLPNHTLGMVWRNICVGCYNTTMSILWVSIFAVVLFDIKLFTDTLGQRPWGVTEETIYHCGFREPKRP